METWLDIFVKKELREYNVTFVKLGDEFFPTANSLLKLPAPLFIFYDFYFYRSNALDAQYKERICDIDEGGGTVSCLFSGTDEILGNVEIIAVYYMNEENKREVILCVP